MEMEMETGDEGGRVQRSAIIMYEVIDSCTTYVEY